MSYRTFKEYEEARRTIEEGWGNKLKSGLAAGAMAFGGMGQGADIDDLLKGDLRPNAFPAHTGGAAVGPTGQRWGTEVRPQGLGQHQKSWKDKFAPPAGSMIGKRLINSRNSKNANTRGGVYGPTDSIGKEPLDAQGKNHRSPYAGPTWNFPNPAKDRPVTDPEADAVLKQYSDPAPTPPAQNTLRKLKGLVPPPVEYDDAILDKKYKN